MRQHRPVAEKLAQRSLLVNIFLPAIFLPSSDVGKNMVGKNI
jgi:hypothetical protein